MKPVRAIDVVWFNYPTYAAAAIVVAGSVFLLAVAPLPDVARMLVAVGAGIAAWWFVASIAAAAWVFDRDSYASFAWIPVVVGPNHGSWLNVTAGFDATSSTLRMVLDPMLGNTLDLFRAEAVHDGPLLRARRSRPPQGISVQPRNSPRRGTVNGRRDHADVRARA
jgi:hypothetical protein